MAEGSVSVVCTMIDPAALALWCCFKQSKAGAQLLALRLLSWLCGGVALGQASSIAGSRRWGTVGNLDRGVNTPMTSGVLLQLNYDWSNFKAE